MKRERRADWRTCVVCAAPYRIQRAAKRQTCERCANTQGQRERRAMKAERKEPR